MTVAAKSRLCSVAGCSRGYYSKEYCSNHYSLWRRHGNPVAGRTSPTQTLVEIERALADARPDSCWLWPFSTNKGGYSQIQIAKQRRAAHQVVCERAHGRAPSPEMEVAHNCGNRRCINPHHLRWATPKENQADRVVHGTTNRGQAHYLARLTEADVLAIRKMSGAGMTAREIAAHFGRPKPTIEAVIQRRSWAWLQEKGT